MCRVRQCGRGGQSDQYRPREMISTDRVLFLSGFALRPARVMFARHLIGPSFCSEKATRQLCLHLSRLSLVLVAVEDILLVVDACRRGSIFMAYFVRALR